MSKKSSMLRRRQNKSAHFTSSEAANKMAEINTEFSKIRRDFQIKERKKEKALQGLNENLVSNNLKLVELGRRPVPILSESEYENTGRIDYLPTFMEIPKEFIYSDEVKFINTWIFKGLTFADVVRLKPREFVDKDTALRAIRTFMFYNETTMHIDHAHKIKACAYLLSDWFELVTEK
jgi:hypothetical protein